MTSFPLGGRSRALLTLVVALLLTLTSAQVALAQDGTSDPGAANVFTSDLGGSAPSTAGTPSASGATIASDKADYPPGSTVYLSGAGWQPGESVRIVVDDDGLQEQVFQRDVTVVADGDGNVADTFQLPNWFVANYTVTATGEQSGVATTAFTDLLSGTSTVSPASVQSGSTTQFTLRVTNTTTNENNDVMGCARVAVPSGYGTATVVAGSLRTSVQDPVPTSGAGWTATIASGNVVQLTAVNGNDRFGSNGWVEVKVSVTAPATAGSSTWTTSAFRGNGCGTISEFLFNTQPSVNVTPACTAVSVTTNPSNETVTYGNNATFTAAAGGTAPVSVQWQRSTDNGATWSNVSGANSTSLTVTKPTVSQSSNRYRAVFTNTCNGTRTATTSEATLTVSAKNLTVNGAVANNKPYDGSKAATVDFTAASLVGVVSGDTVTLVTSGYSAEFNDKNVGTDKPVTVTGVALGGADAANYTVSQPTGLKANITSRQVTVTADPQSKTYGEDDPALTYQVTSGSVVSGDGFSGALTRDAGENVGDYAIKQGTLTLGSNYELSFVGANLTIGPATLFVDAADKLKTYGEDDPQFTYALRGFVDDEAADSAGVTGAAGCSRVAGEDVGEYEIACAPGDLKIDESKPQNYVFAMGTKGKLTISAATLYVDADDQSKTYGDDDPELSYTLRGFRFSDDADSAGVTGAADCSRAAGDDAGEYDITCEPGSLAIGTGFAKNYVFAAGNTGTLTIEPATLFVDAADKLKTYGDDDPQFTYALRGFVDDEAADSAGVTGAAGCSRVAGEDVGEYEITCAPGDLKIDESKPQNYVFATGNKGKLTISQKGLTGSFTAADKVYNGNANATVTGRSLNGVVGTDDVSLSGGTASFEDKNVGDDKTVTLTGATLAGGKAGNYTLGSVDTTTADITARDLHVTASGVDKVYDGNTTAQVNLSTDKLSGDYVSVSYAGASFADKNVGTDKDVSVSGISISGGVDAGNYQLANTTAETKANITAKPLTGGFTAANKVYDGNRDATVTSRSLPGVISGDDVSLVVTNPLFDTKDVGTNKVVTGSLSLTGTGAGNYSVNSPATTTANITAWTAQGSGFYQPVGIENSVFVAAPGSLPGSNASTVWNAAKGGSTIPLKFNVFAGGVEKTSTSDISGFSALKLQACAAGAATDSVDFVTTGNTSLRYDTVDKQFIQNWKTPTVSAETCYRASVTFADGSSLSAFFKLRK